MFKNKLIALVALFVLLLANTAAIAWACDNPDELPPAPDAVYLINEGHDMWFYYKLYYDDGNGLYMTAHVLKSETGILPDENGDV